MRRLILGTAGHIDHGKTSLVRALTGVDTDRLAEEKRRGITIDLGFANLTLPGDVELGIVDVPGHEAFIRNMLAGATGLDLVLLVVAADEGVMPQTREHLAITGLLGVRAAVVAVTKIDLVEHEWLDLVTEDIRGELRTTPFAASPLVPVSAETGEGLDSLVALLAAAAGGVAERSAEDVFRLPIDRVFTIRGTGTVVTGTVWSGQIGREATARVLPGDWTARVRTVQAHGRETDQVRAGQRAAIALAGVDRAHLRRGDVLVAEPAWRAGHMHTARLRLLPETEWVVRPRQRVRFHLGTAEVMGRVVPLDGRTLAAGETGWVQIRLEAPVAARAGDSFVIRSFSPVTTIGGGVITEPAAAKRKRLSRSAAGLLDAILAGPPDDAVVARLELAGWAGVPADRLPIETPHPPATVAASLASLARGGARCARIGDLLFHGDVVRESRSLLLRAADAFHQAQPIRPGMDRDELRRALPPRSAPVLAESSLVALMAQGDLVPVGSLIARAGFQPALSVEQRRVRDLLLDTFRAAGLTPPTLNELPDTLRQSKELWPVIKLLEHQDELVALGPELFATRAALEDAAQTARRALAPNSSLAPADFKSVFPVSRKFLIPLLEYFDRSGITRRVGDARVLPEP